ncbi:sex-regulated protein janus-A [Drosophila serrata]|uniref:sex-regulated protein janus-A n=1 Tax=Drosophila serrata TaxID=7274 RepID=UPI000A1D1933|nr:sex-regulated protein janus-A [Drosophila serrata]
MSTELIESVPLVKISPQGIFKYILINITDGGELTKTVVRGFDDCEWHADIFEREEVIFSAQKLEAECIGGGRIEHDPEKKYMKVYGYSQGFGKADHSQSKQILKTKYPDYRIEISDDGY